MAIYFARTGCAGNGEQQRPCPLLTSKGSHPMRWLHPWTFLALAACSAPAPAADEGDTPEVVVAGAFVYAPITAAQAAGYLVLHNRASTPDTVRAVEVDWASHASIHQTSETDGMVRMSHLEVLVVPARDSVVLAPGGIHLMFMDLSRLPVAGDTVELTLQLARGGRIVVPAAVRAYGQ